MLGRVRASPMGSLELLEMERPNSKIIKHDSLSIYESTLMKLKQGSHCNPRCNPEDSARTDPDCTNMATSSPEEAVSSDADCCSTDSFPNSIPCFQSTGPLKAQGNRNMSILYFFSKYKSSQSQHAQSSNDKEEMAIESGYSSSSSG
ncbi:uncharacterized protein LOC105158076 [Sesamum indicum]|uniref:Uncharacterized protein LOC105158076 n=1 Tax=Sesamum indicum TaxID=4182 RepID=A0A6I9SYY2_SESIN|nr:uncharacterized protein LOC105158076 [Sesamum indicum]